MKGHYDNQLLKRAEKFVGKEDPEGAKKERPVTANSQVFSGTAQEGSDRPVKAIQKGKAEKNTSLGGRALGTASTASTGLAKKRAGRPAREEGVKIISLAIPESLFPDVESAALLTAKGNKTAYIINLIRKDIQENGELYEKFKELTRQEA